MTKKVTLSFQANLLAVLPEEILVPLFLKGQKKIKYWGDDSSERLRRARDSQLRDSSTISVTGKHFFSNLHQIYFLRETA